MPLTRYHLGPGLFFGILFLRFLDLPTFLLANVIVDLEPYFVFSLCLNIPHHGFVHSFLGGTLIALILSGIMFLTRNLLNPVMSFFKLDQERSFIKILMASISGIYLHILFDAPTHSYMQPFFPFDTNIFYDPWNPLAFSISTLCDHLLLAGLIAYMIRLVLYYWRRKLRRVYLNPTNKFRQRGISLVFPSIFFILMGFNEIFIWYNEIRLVITIVLLILLPIMIIAFTIDFISIIEAFQKSRKLKLIRLKNWNHNCTKCGTNITLEEKFCKKCGAENLIRKYVLQSLKNQEKIIPVRQIKILDK
ncbi:MAG: hypothetical protein ACFE9S_19405 [Candidatus Hermodarchaeota archaeon]